MTLWSAGRKPPRVHTNAGCTYTHPLVGYCTRPATHLVMEFSPIRDDMACYRMCEQHAMTVAHDFRRIMRKETFQGERDSASTSIEVVPISWYQRDVDRVTLFDDDNEYDDDDDDDDDDWYDDYDE